MSSFYDEWTDDDYEVPLEDDYEIDKRNINFSNPSQPIKTDKVGRNEPCPCGSGKSIKNAVWKDDDLINP